jgi:hypothetical protein
VVATGSLTKYLVPAALTAGIVTSVATVAAEENEVLSSVSRSTASVEFEPESVIATSTLIEK